MIKNIITNDDDFPPLGATLVVDLNPQTKHGEIKHFSTWKLVGGKSKSPSNGRTVNNPDGKSYKNALRIDTTVTRTKRPKTPSPKSEGTVSIKRSLEQ